MKRRSFITKAGMGGTAVAAPAVVAQARREWRLATVWPREFPGLGAGAALLADLVTTGTQGRLTVRVFGAGELVPAAETLDAVTGGTLEMGYGIPAYWKHRAPATRLLAGMPFGLTAQEMNGWLDHGGGRALAEEIYAELGCKFFACGNTGMAMGGWFNEEVKVLEDYAGLRMRVTELGAEVVEAAGATVVDLPGSEIAAALRAGEIDAAAWMGPYNDLALRLHETARFYYYPGWHAPATMLDCFVNRAAWESLPADEKSVLETATAAVNLRVLGELTARNSDALATLVKRHGVLVRRFSDELLNELGAIAGDLLGDLAEGDPPSKKLMASILAYRADALRWSRLSTESFLTARNLPFRFARV